MSLYTADRFEGVPIRCDEGELEWVDKEKVWSLELWEEIRYSSGFWMREEISFH